MRADAVRIGRLARATTTSRAPRAGAEFLCDEGNICALELAEQEQARRDAEKAMTASQDRV
jgi:hypothetical protein